MQQIERQGNFEHVNIGYKPLTFEDIPDSPSCLCSSPTQKEFILDFNPLVGNKQVEFNHPVPGYGCLNPECGIKLFDINIIGNLYQAAADHFRNNGDTNSAEALESHKRALSGSTDDIPGAIG